MQSLRINIKSKGSWCADLWCRLDCILMVNSYQWIHTHMYMLTKGKVVVRINEYATR
jgi:hypothetical protein